MTPRRIAGVGLVGIATLAGMAFAGLFTSAMVTARGDPQAALARWPVDGARTGAATAMLAADPSRDPGGRAGRLATEVLARSPVNAEAVRTVAMSRLTTGDLGGARRIIALGEGLSRRDIPTQMWLIEDRVQAGDIAGALIHYDRALRTQKDSREVLLPILAQAADDPAVARSLAPRLAARPEWWSDFLGRFVQVARSPVAIRLVADGLQLDPASEIDRGRIAQIVARLVELGDYRSARSLYDNRFRLRATATIDGGFEQDRGVPPFDWQLVDEADRSATREPREGASGNALSVAGTEGKEVARQLLALAPGRYRLAATSGATEAGTIAPPTLSLACAKGGGAALATTSFPVAVGPRRWAVTFTVPAGCDGQWLSIASASNVGYLGESPWIDNLAIAPLIPPAR